MDKRAFAKEIITHFVNRFSGWGHSAADFDEQAPLLVTFLTRTAGLNHPTDALTDFNKAYFKLLQAKYGNKLARTAPIQPLTYAFVDCSGSRIGNTEACDFPHVHALMLAHPEDAAHMQALCRSLSLFSDVQNFDPEKGSLEDLATYCMKGLFSSRGEILGRGDWWGVFPRLTTFSAKARFVSL
jgi:hypothetical protein